MSKHVDVEMSSLDQVIARENQLHLMFVKTGVSLRAENDETEIINGFLALFIKPTASISWVPSSVLDSEDTFIYNQFAKRTKNSLILNKSPETKPLKSINRESITIQIENISHIVIQSDLTLDSNLDSVCVVKLVIFAKDLLGDSNVPRSQVSSLDDEEQAINALGGGRYPPFWFQKEKLQVQAFSSQHQKLPTLSEVVSELTFWLNSIALGLVKHDTLPVYFITPFQANPNSPILIPKQPAPQHGIMGLMDKMSSMGMSVVKGGFGEQAAGDLKNVC